MVETKIAHKHKHLCILKAPASWKPIPEYCAHNLLLIIYVGYNSFFFFFYKEDTNGQAIAKTLDAAGAMLPQVSDIFETWWGDK